MEPHDQQTAVVKLLHQGELFFQIHRSGTADGAAGLRIMRELHRNETAGVQDQIGLLEETLAADRHQFRIAGTGADDFDVAGAERSGIQRKRESKVAAFGEPAFLLFDEQRAAVRAFQRGGLGHAGAASSGQSLLRRIRHVDSGQRFGRIDFRTGPGPAGKQGLQQGLVFFQFDGPHGRDGFRDEPGIEQLRRNGFGNAGRIALFPAAEAQMEHRRAEDQHRQTLRDIRQRTRRDGDQQAEAGQVEVFAAIEDLHVVGFGLFEGIRALVADFEQQGRGLFLHEGEDGAVHLGRRRFHLPAVGPVEGIEGPEAFVVALGGDDGLGAEERSEAARQVVGAADVAGDDGDDEFAGTVDADDRRVAIFILQRRSNAADANTKSPDENDSVKFLPMILQKRSIRSNRRTSGYFVFRINNASQLRFFASLAQKMLAIRKTIRCYAFS